MLSMEQVYSIMHYLNDSHVDRVYPVDITELSSFQGNSKVMKLNYNSFVGITDVQFLIRVLPEDDSEEGTEKTLNVTSSFCMDSYGKTPLHTFEDQEETITLGEKKLITFKLDWDSVMAKESHELTGVRSIRFSFDENVYRCFIHSVIFRSSDYRYTLEDLEQAYLDGQNYVRDRLNNSKVVRGIMDIPEELERYVIMCSGAYAWLTVWEYESKPMKELKSESNNYADRLFGTVDKAISNYLTTFQNDPNKDYINTKVIGSKRLNWGLFR